MKDDPDTTTSLNNLAALYKSQGAYAKAEPLYLPDLDIIPLIETLWLQ